MMVLLFLWNWSMRGCDRLLVFCHIIFNVFFYRFSFLDHLLDRLFLRLGLDLRPNHLCCHRSFNLVLLIIDLLGRRVRSMKLHFLYELLLQRRLLDWTVEHLIR